MTIQGGECFSTLSSNSEKKVPLLGFLFFKKWHMYYTDSEEKNEGKSSLYLLLMKHKNYVMLFVCSERWHLGYFNTLHDEQFSF